MLWALTKKELREHFPLAAIGLAGGLFVAGLYARSGELYPGYSSSLLWRMLGAGSQSWFAYNELPVPIAYRSYLGKLGLVCYGLALLLGFLMSWKEEVKRTWHFLWHRPVRRGQVLGAKLLAGALLYLPAGAAPFAFLAYWCSVPGHFPAPWAIELIYPGVEVIARGYVVFLGAFLCGIRPAKWYATKFVPLIGMVVLLIASSQIPIWYAVIPAFALTGVALLGAIWRVYARHHRLRVVTILLLTLGITPVLLVVGLTAISALNVQHPSYAGESVSGIRFSPEGDPQLLVQQHNPWGHVLKTLDGQVVADEMRRDDERVQPLPYLVGKAQSTPHSRWWQRPIVPPFRMVTYYYGYQTQRLLYQLSSPEQLLVAYDKRTGQVAGYWCPDGFVANRESAVSVRSVGGYQNYEPLRVDTGQALHFLDTKLRPLGSIPLSFRRSRT